MISFVLFPEASQPNMNFNIFENWPISVSHIFSTAVALISEKPLDCKQMTAVKNGHNRAYIPRNCLRLDSI